MTKFLRGLLLVDGVNPRNLPEQLCTWPHELLTSSQELRFVSTAVMRSDDGPLGSNRYSRLTDYKRAPLGWPIERSTGALTFGNSGWRGMTFYLTFNVLWKPQIPF